MRIFILFLLVFNGLFSSEEKKIKEELKEETVVTEHETETLKYVATAGNMLLRNEDFEPEASVFYVAYTKKDDKDRPLTFIFNGGPGSSAIWLHMGFVGPKRVKLGENLKPPYTYEDNPFTLLSASDLVFIDPVSTGYSRVAMGVDPAPYHGVQGDIESVAEVIRQYISKNGRWRSPLFLMGESYGTTRAVGVAEELHEKHRIYLNGLILISLALDFQTVRFEEGNELVYPLFFPSYAAAGYFHKKVAAKSLDLHLIEAERFALGPYLSALMKGDALGDLEVEALAEKMEALTGLPSSWLVRKNLRPKIWEFMKGLLRSEGRIVGRMDSRVSGYDSKLASEDVTYDPGLESIWGAFNSAFNSYLMGDLGIHRDRAYISLNPAVHPWKWPEGKYLNLIPSLKETMTRNAHLGVFVASGYADLATPYFGTDFVISHLALPKNLQENILSRTYRGGHMMYLEEEGAEQLHSDISEFYETFK